MAVGVTASLMLVGGCSTMQLATRDANPEPRIGAVSTATEYMKRTPDDERHRLVISIPDQRMVLLEGEKIMQEYVISTALKGVSEAVNSDGTPRGLHVIAEKIGGGQPVGMIFKGRAPTGEISALNPKEGIPPVVTRLFRLRGLESSNLTTYDRLIYLHGSPHEALLGQPASGGCIRMRSEDVVALFDTIEIGTPITILEIGLTDAVVATLERQRSYAELRQRARLEGSTVDSAPAAMHRLCAGHMYGIHGVAQNFPAAKLWCELAGAKGATSALTLLAELYEHGYAGEVDLPKARRLYETAAARSHIHAMKKAASMQQQGIGGSTDIAAAMQNMARLASLGYVDGRQSRVDTEATTKQAAP